ncbi:hypothetical protein BpHYR1_025569, partial [Brachionus plicatilis]
MTSIEILTDSKIGNFRLDLTEAEPRFNFTKADWGLFGNTLDGMITEINNENLNDIKSFDG